TDGTPVKLLTEGYTLKLGKNMAAPKNSKATYSDGTFTTAGTTEGYNLSDDGKSITYSAATTKTFEFEGLDDDTTAKNFWLSGKTITVGKDAVKTDGTPVKLLTDGYTLTLGKGMSEGYTLSDDGKSIMYTASETDALSDSLWGNTDDRYQLFVSENFAADDMLQILSVDSSQDAFFNSSDKEKEITLAIGGSDTFKDNAGKLKS
ncbi:MAG: hypothetical protein IJR52_07415, partial [Selenomonadaceae bacterium]|nr:hypothetical protein [Selenomonadaceae bacterium]